MDSETQKLLENLGKDGMKAVRKLNNVIIEHFLPWYKSHKFEIHENENERRHNQTNRIQGLFVKIAIVQRIEIFVVEVSCRKVCAEYDARK